ncbi:MAG TPA: hypothetical protein VIF57_12550 [Polyangia bacterium]
MTQRFGTVLVAALALGGCGSGGRARSDGGAIDLSGAGGATGGTGGAAGTGDDGGCAWTLGAPSAVAGPAPARGSSADLQGPTIGDAPFDADMQRRLVPVTVVTPSPGIEVGTAYLTRLSPQDETAAYLTIPVTNNGSAHPCFLVASPLRYKDAGGLLLNADATLSYVTGSVGDAGFGFYTDSCLAPGDRGYFIDIQLSSNATIFSSTASIEVTLAAQDGTTPLGRLVPTGYDLGTCAGARALRLFAVNDGSGPISVPLYGGFPDSPAILLDAGGLPAGWTYLGVTEAASVPIDLTATYTGSVASAPAVSRAHFFLQFGPPPTTADASMLAAPPDGLAAALDALRASRQELRARWRAAISARGYRQIP